MVPIFPIFNKNFLLGNCQIFTVEVKTWVTSTRRSRLKRPKCINTSWNLREGKREYRSILSKKVDENFTPEFRNLWKRLQRPMSFCIQKYNSNLLYVGQLDQALALFVHTVINDNLVSLGAGEPVQGEKRPNYFLATSGVPCGPTLLVEQIPGIVTHYSKSQFFVQKFNFDKTPTF